MDMNMGVQVQGVGKLVNHLRKKKKKLLPCNIDLNLNNPKNISKKNFKRRPNSNLGSTSCFLSLFIYFFMFVVAHFDTIVIPFHIIVVHFHACCCFAFCLLLFLFMCYCFFFMLMVSFLLLFFWACYYLFFISSLLFTFVVVCLFLHLLFLFKQFFFGCVLLFLYVNCCFCVRAIAPFKGCHFSSSTCSFIVVPLHAYCCCSSI